MNWPNEAALDDLLLLAQSAKREEQRVNALRGCARLLALPSEEDAKARVQRCATVMSMATGDEEKRAVLEGLAMLMHPAALKLVLPYLNEDALKNDAIEASLKIARAISSNHKETAKAAAARIASATDEAEYLRTSSLQSFLNLRLGTPGQLPRPIKDFEQTMGAQARAMLAQIGSCSAVGSFETVTDEMASFIERTGADELMLVASIFDHQKRLRSFELAAEAGRQITS